MEETTLSSSSALSRSHRRLRAAAADMAIVLFNWINGPGSEGGR